MLIRAACHVHSCWSYDGSWPLTRIAAEFSRRGYRIVMTTEHDLGFSEPRRLLHREACAEGSTPQIYVLPGIEYSDASNTVHILVWGDVPFLGEGVPTTELLKAVKAANGVAVLAHPSRRNAWQLYNSAWENDLTGIELWNRKTDGWAPSREGQLLLGNSRITAFAGLDFHDQRQLFPLAMNFDLPGVITEASILGYLRTQRAHATAFNAPINGRLLRAASTALKAAEFGRRSAASAYRRIRTV